MARINVEDDLGVWRPFARLVKALGDEDRALGMTIRFWRLAQKYWGNECSLVPFEEFEAEELEVLLKVRMAEKRENGIYAKGSEDQFGWYLQKCRASKKGGEATRNKTANEPDDSPIDSREIAGAQPVDSPLTLTLSPSLTLSQKKEDIYSVDQEKIGKCLQEWAKTLERHKIQKDPWLDAPQIGQLIQNHKKVDKVALACLGAGYEAKSDGYDPSKNIGITRLFNPKIFDKFVNLGAQARQSEAVKKEKAAEHAKAIAAASISPMDDMPEQNAEKIREIQEKLFGRRA